MKKFFSLTRAAVLTSAFCLLTSYMASAQNGVSINTTGNPAASGNMLEVLQTGTANGSNGLYLTHTGALTAAGTKYGLQSLISGASFAGSTHIGGYFSASGATNNYSGIFMGGNVGIGTATPSAKALLQMVSTSTGLLVPNMTQAQRVAIAPAGTDYGLLVYQTDAPVGFPAGYWYWDGAAWNMLLDSSPPNAGWSVLGNAGLVDGTSNFLGTTTAIPIKFVTNGTGNIRMTIDASGYIGMNVAPSSSYQLYVNSALAGADNASIFGYATGANRVYGLYGQATSIISNASGVFGYASGASGATNGVWGESVSTDDYAAGVYALATQPNANGLYAYNSAASGTGNGDAIYATSSQGGGACLWSVQNHIDGDGAYGINNAAASTGQGTGLTGITYQTGGGFANAGVWGMNLNGGVSAGPGVGGYYGASAGAAAFLETAVSGITNSSIANGSGGWFGCDNATGYGVGGQSTGSSGTGVYGYASGGTAAAGLFGYAAGSSGIGVYGYTAAANAGLGTGGYFYNASNTTSGGSKAVYGSSPGSVTGFVLTAIYGYTGFADALNYDALYGRGRLVCTGTKSAEVPTSKGRTLLYCVESPEVWFEDFGNGQLQNGYALINLDPIFLETVTINNEHPMQVFVQLEDECLGGVYVTKKTTGFEVHQQGGTNSNAKFSYRIVAKRKGDENERLAVSKPYESVTEREPKLQFKSSLSASKKIEDIMKLAKEKDKKFGAQK